MTASARQLAPKVRSWLNQRVFSMWEDPDFTPCPHLRVDPHLRLGHVVLWGPPMVLCDDCLPMTMPDEAERHVCDRCDETDLDVSLVLAATIRERAVVVVHFGTCERCDRVLGIDRPGAPRRLTPRRKPLRRSS